LFKAALGLLKIMKKDLMNLNNIEELNDYLEKREFSFNDVSEVVYFLLLRRFEFDNALINKLRKTHEKKIIKEMNHYNSNNLIEQQIKFEEDLKAKKLLKMDLTRNSCLGVSEKCNRNWPLCIYDKFFKLNLINYLIFRTADVVNIIEDYFYKNNTSKFNTISLMNGDSDKNQKILTHEKEMINIINSNINFINEKDDFNSRITIKKNSANAKLNLIKFNDTNSDLTLKDINIEENFYKPKDLIFRFYDSTHNLNMNEQSNNIKFCTPETNNTKFYVDSIAKKNNNVSNFHLEKSSKNSSFGNIKTEFNINEIKIENKASPDKKPKNLILIENKSYNSSDNNEENENSLESNDAFLYSIKDQEFIVNSIIGDDEVEDEEEIDFNFNDLSFDERKNSFKREEGYMNIESISKNFTHQNNELNINEKNYFKFNDSITENNHFKNENNKRSHSNRMKKIKDIRKENKKRIQIYKTLLINRRRHYCQLISNAVADKETNINTAKIDHTFTLVDTKDSIYKRYFFKHLNIN